MGLSPNKGPELSLSVESSKLIVEQPAKLKELATLLETFENLNARVSERTGEDVSSDLGAAGVAARGQSGGYVSPRDQAIAAIPAEVVMREQLVKHIEAEVKELEHLASSIRRAARPGVAYRVNQLYARIRRLNSLLAEIFEASIEVLKRLFVRVFIDKQSVI